MCVHKYVASWLCVVACGPSVILPLPPCSVSFYPLILPFKRPHASSLFFSNKGSLFPLWGLCSLHFLKSCYWFLTNQLSVQMPHCQRGLSWPYISQFGSLYHILLFTFIPPLSTSFYLFVYCLLYLPQECKFPRGRFLVSLTHYVPKTEAVPGI